MAAIMGRTTPQLAKQEASNEPHNTPKNTAMPPMTGTGRFCSLRASGLSTRFFAFAMASILK